MADDLNSFKGIKESIERLSAGIENVANGNNLNFSKIATALVELGAAVRKLEGCIETIEQFNAGVLESFSNVDETLSKLSLTVQELQKKANNQKHFKSYSEVPSVAFKLRPQDLILPASIFIGIVTGNLVAAAITAALQCI